MKAVLVLLLAASPAISCDWKVSERIDPMTDLRDCTITSASARLGIGVSGDRVQFVSASPYRFDYLTVRVDDNPAIRLPDDGRSTTAFRPEARELLAQIRAGERIRVQYRDIDGTVNGDAMVCNLPELIDACSP